jgi:hypothetical protein
MATRDARIPARYKRFIAERRREWHSFARSASRVDAHHVSTIRARQSVNVPKGPE